TVYVALNVKQADHTVWLLRVSLFIVVPLLLGLVALTTWILVGRALRPVEAIRSEVAAVSREDVTKRVPVPEGNDEISRLAVTMNDMLVRLEAAVGQQRQFVADASHELQNPLAAMRADLEVALAHPEGQDWQARARELLAENQQMERLVSDLL